MTDQEIIQKIEEHYGFKLQLVEFKSLRNKNIIRDKRDEGTRNYSINDNGFVDGICLDLSDKPIPKELDSLKSIRLLSLRRCYTKNKFSLNSFSLLESLDLSNNKLVELDFLSNQLALKSIDLSKNDIHDIAILSSLSNLTSIDLSYNRIKSIQPISRLTKLTILNLSHNELEDISALKELKELSNLKLRSVKKKPTKITIENLTNHLSNYRSLDFTVIGELRSLRVLDLGENDDIVDYSFLKELQEMRILRLDENNLSNFSELIYLKNLVNLNLNKNNITDISFLRSLSKLTILNLSNNQISNIYPISDLISLDSLNLSKNNISGIGQFALFKNMSIKSLLINGNQICTKYKISLNKSNQNNHLGEVLKVLSTFKAVGVSQLESKIGTELILLSGTDQYSSAEFYKNQYSYNVNAYDDVVRLNIKESNINDLNILKRLKKLTHLNLVSNQIINISPLSDLKELKYLDLSTNNITDISSISILNKLKWLHLDNNNIQVIPVLELPELKELWLYTNQIKEIENLSSLKNLCYLNLSENYISDITCIKEFNLIDLYLNSNNIQNISPLHNKVFRNLDLSQNKINDVCPFSSIEINQELNLSKNSIFDLSPLYNLIKNNTIFALNIKSNPLKYPPIEIAEQGNDAIVNWFQKIIESTNNIIKRGIDNKKTSLNLGNCGLTDLSMISELFNYTDLEELILSNHYAQYNHNKNGWDIEETKNIGVANNIRYIPEDIKKLGNLKRLIIGGDWKMKNSWNRFRLKNISNICLLSNLEYLNISNNEIQEITGLNMMNKLKSIHANNNFITDIKPIEGLEDLEELFISNNLLTSIDSLANLKSIKTIDLHGNKISDLSLIANLINRLDITDDKWLINTICINDNPLVNPPIEFVRRGKDAVINIINENAKGPTFNNNDVKLVLVGNSEAGKSTLAYYLKNNKLPKKKLPFTMWLDEIKITINGNNVRILDFGGHDYFHDTHHIFFGNNMIYILLWEKGTNKLAKRQSIQKDQRNIDITNEFLDYPLRYWLDSVEFYTKKKRARNFFFNVDEVKTIDSYSSYTLLVQNKVQTFEDIESIHNKTYKDEYPFIYDFLTIDVLSKRNTRHFKSIITEMLTNTPIVGAKYPEYYKTIKKSLVEFKDLFMIDVDVFRDHCNTICSEQITDDNFYGILYYLDDIGEILYQDGKTFIFTNIKELSKMIISVFSGLEKESGVFNFKYVQDKIGDYSSVIIDLMVKYCLIFKSPNNPTNYIAPMYLPKKPNKLVKIFSENKTQIPFRRFIYPGFIHKNIILQIFEKYCDKILLINDNKSNESAEKYLNDNLYIWRDGLILKDKDTQEIIMLTFNISEVNENAFIDIKCLNDINSNKIFVRKIIEFIVSINKDYKDAKEMVTLDGDDFVELELLIQNAENKILTFRDRYLTKENEHEKEKKILNNITLTEYKEYIKEKMSMKKVFISYSHQNITEMKELTKYLSTLVRNGKIEPWTDLELESGMKVKEEILTKLQEADIVILLISQDFIASDFIYDNELPLAMKKKLNGTGTVIPVYLSSCTIFDSELEISGEPNNLKMGDYYLVPQDENNNLKPIEEWEHKSQAWTKVYNEVKKKLL